MGMSEMAKTYKVAFNARVGNFSLSPEAARLARKISGDPQWADTILPEELAQRYVGDEHRVSMDAEHPRHDPVLVRVVEELGKAANGPTANLAVAIIEGNTYLIEEKDGKETVMTPAKVKWIIIPDEAAD
jgi:hypothetical protein